MITKKFYQWGTVFLALLLLATMSGCATSGQATDPSDPFEETNRSFYKFNDGLDKNFFQPVARGYAKVAPPGVRDSVTNFFDNATYLNVIMNAFLQGKFDQGFQDSGRFIVNSTLGIGGLFDPATGMGLPQHDEDLGQTFGVWGAEEGAYLMLPLFGPDTVRDVPDRITSPFTNPLFYLAGTITIPLTALQAINERANFLEATRLRDEAALDPYTFTREAFRQQRNFLIYDGNPPSSGLDEFIEALDDTDAGVLKVF
jgi:phospholipid-binding lipoprotein MlaA